MEGEAEADATRGQHAAEITRLTANFSRQLADQSSALQASQSEADRLRGQLAEAGEKFGKATGELEALRPQVAGQTDVIKGFTASVQGNKKIK